ncbi:MAG: M15 family metallopeptidase [Coxiellaceae bacterium]|nr:MAG: M15 family metallopeptidase [Coxiellaceae bacterium]
MSNNIKKLKSSLFTLAMLGIYNVGYANKLPPNFVYLSDIDPTIQQDIRYADQHNFIGRPVKGYGAPACILTKPAAQALQQVQTVLRAKGLGLKVYDCYRPQMAVNDFIQWSQQPKLQQTKAEFYPRVNKADLFKLGYVAQKSGHSRGSTMDLTIIPLHGEPQAAYHPGQKLVACYAPLSQRFRDNSIDMGTGYDCLDKTAAFSDTSINKTAQQNRSLLQQIMTKYGFVPYEKEWWHFTLRNEPYQNTYFNFLIAN